MKWYLLSACTKRNPHVAVLKRTVGGGAAGGAQATTTSSRSKASQAHLHKVPDGDSRAVEGGGGQPLKDNG
ncbi:hypothetical protein INR49_009783 [Caranx melampygus]|nr:hypothetical protein INR49_009783 [Caranx melampygus]